MKKFLLIALLSVGAMISHAQTAMTSAAYPANAVDTVTNTATKYLVSKAIKGADVVTVQFYATEISGTTGGTATLQGSLDGTNWYTIGSAYTLTDVASQCTSFKVTSFGDLYLRVAVTGTGTMSDKVYAKWLAR